MFKKLLRSAKKIGILFFGVLCFNTIGAQVDSEPHTGLTPEEEAQFLELLPQLQELENAFLQRKMQRHATSFTNYVPIKPHIIRMDNGTGGLSEEDLYDAIALMNVIYEASELEFFICGGINYIDDSDYFNFQKSEESALTAANNVDDVINIYFANTVISATGSNLCGYAYFPGGPETIMMKNSCAVNGSTLSHEVGHFFALSHTHGNSAQTNELVDGSNCSISGDFICDTPADPRLSYSNVNWDCEYTGTDTDANNDTYIPDELNLMSYSRKACRNTFSSQQLARMNAVYFATRSNLICQDFNVGFETAYTNDCDNSMTVDFTDNSVGATAWEWDVDSDGFVDYTTQNPTHTYTDASKYDVSLKITSADGITIGKMQPEMVNIGVRSVQSSEIELTLNTDNRPSEITWFLRDENGFTIQSGGPYQEGSQDEVTITETLDVSAMGGCFSFEIVDSDGDGLIGSNSVGSYELRDGDGNLIVHGSDFGSNDLTYMTGETLAAEGFLTPENIQIVPNPVKNTLFIKTGKLESYPDYYVIYSTTGRAIKKGFIQSEDDLKINVEAFRSGMYIIKMKNKFGSIALPFIKE
ncbi:MAG: T9SS type A sorting domain-containing protein [Bacteroidota bacterium]